jgi:cytochrome c
VKILCFALAAAFASSGALGQEVLRAKGCVSCHDMDERKVGPSLREIRAKYKGDKSKAPEIVAKMKEGKGHPKVAGSDAELRAAVEAAVSTQ